MEQAAELGKLLAKNGVTVVYGGGKKGLMGCVADNALEKGGKVKGVIPKILVDLEHQHNTITELLVVEDMHQRKRKLYELCDAAIVLPGGFGTLDEMFEIITWNGLTIHDKKIFILNTGGFYNHLLQHLEVMKSEGFLYTNPEESVVVLDEATGIVTHLKN